MKKQRVLALAMVVAMSALACNKEPEPDVELPEAELNWDDEDDQEQADLADDSNIEADDVEDETEIIIDYSPAAGLDYKLKQTLIDEEHFKIELLDSDEKSLQEFELETYGVYPIQCAAFDFFDLNSDGYLDVPAVVAMGNVNISYQLYLWNHDKNCLEANDFIGDEGGFIDGAEPDGMLFISSRDSAAAHTTSMYTWDNTNTIRKVKEFYSEYTTDGSVQYTISGENGPIIDELLSEDDANSKWDSYNEFFAMRVEKTETVPNGIKYIGYVYSGDNRDKKETVEFTIDSNRHLVK